MPVAVITGASAGFGSSLARALAARSWSLVIDARGEEALGRVAQELAAVSEVVAIAGDVADPVHRRAVAAAVNRLGRLDLLVNNASTLGPSPLPPLAELDVDALRAIFEVNVLAPLALVGALLPALTASGGAIVNVSSDAAVEPYPGWGGYGSAKAALDQLTAVLGPDHPTLAVHAFDPGDMRTEMHQRAYPGEDIDDRPTPESVVPSFLRLIDERPPSGRYRASDLPAPAEVPA